MSRGSSPLRTVLLLGLCAGVAALGLVNWWVVGLEPGLPPAVAATAPAGATPAAISGLSRPVADRPLSDFAETLRRPLFIASRSPFASSRAEPSQLPLDIRVTGIAIDAGKKQVLLQTPHHPQGQWVEEGHSIDGWLLRTVRDDAVILASGQQTRELRLYPTLGGPPAQR
jgi:hypothetical protein